MRVTPFPSKSPKKKWLQRLKGDYQYPTDLSQFSHDYPLPSLRLLNVAFGNFFFLFLFFSSFFSCCYCSYFLLLFFSFIYFPFFVAFWQLQHFNCWFISVNKKKNQCLIRNTLHNRLYVSGLKAFCSTTTKSVV